MQDLQRILEIVMQDLQRILEIVMQDLKVCTKGDGSHVSNKFLEELANLFCGPKPHASMNSLVFHQSGAAATILQAMIKYKDRPCVLAHAMRALLDIEGRKKWNHCLDFTAWWTRDYSSSHGCIPRRLSPTLWMWSFV